MQFFELNTEMHRIMGILELPARETAWIINTLINRLFIGAYFQGWFYCTLASIVYLCEGWTAFRLAPIKHCYLYRRRSCGVLTARHVFASELANMLPGAASKLLHFWPLAHIQNNGTNEVI